MQNDDFALLAVIDAYKWWVSSDYGFLRTTGALDRFGGAPEKNSTSVIDRLSLRKIARAYSVSRNIPADDMDSQAQEVVNLFMKSPPPELRSKDLLARATAIAEMSIRTPMIITRKDGRKSKRQLASALTKLSWFVQPEGWTVFDKYVGVAVIGQDRAGLTQMCQFYQKLAPSWQSTSQDVCRAADSAGLHPYLGYRIIDKYLFCHGLGMYRQRDQEMPTPKLIADSTLAEKLSRPTVEEHRRSLNWTLEALGEPVASSLRMLAADVESSLTKLPVYNA